MSIAEILVSPLALALFGYVGVVIALSFIVRPFRIKMVDIAEEMLADHHWNKEERAEINQLLDTCLSFRVGFVVPAALVWAILGRLGGRVPAEIPEFERLFADDRFDRLVIRYFASILAANPFATILTVPLTFVLLLVRFVTGDRSVRNALDAPVVQASSRIHGLRAAA